MLLCGVLWESSDGVGTGMQVSVVNSYAAAKLSVFVSSLSMEDLLCVCVCVCYGQLIEHEGFTAEGCKR
jgi:hypothetical protein